MVRIFKRSVEKRGVRFVKYLGDGDSKSYSAVSNAQPYGPDVVVEKLECVGHVQKRMGKLLLDKVQQCKGKEFYWEGRKYKGIGGSGKLHKAAIKRIQGHYGAAIRNNVGNLEGMKASIWRIWHHRNRNHSSCDNSCPAVNGSGDGNSNSLPPFVLEEIKPVFETLTADSLLSKCLHGGTQNNNESFHRIIWLLCPKVQFVQKPRLELAVNCAVLQFNDGGTALAAVYDILGIPIGKQLVMHTHKKDLQRIKASKRRATYQRATKARRPDKSDYQAGAF